MTAFVVLLAAYVLSQFFRAFLAIVAQDLSRDLALTPADLGAISGAWFAAFALAQFPVGYLLDRAGPRRTVAGLMLAAVAGAAWLAAASTFAEALGAMALIGIGCSPILMGSLVVFVRTQPPERFAMLSSLMIGLGSAGNLLGASPLALAVEAFGWRAAMGGIAAITLLSALVVFLALRDPPPTATASGEDDGVLAGMLAILRLRPLWLLLPLTFAGYAVVIAVRALWIGPFFGEVHGFDLRARGEAALAMSVAMTAGALAYGPLERLVGDPKPIVLAGSLVTAALFLLLAALGADSAGAAVLMVTGIGLSGMTYALLMAHGRRFFPGQLIGRGMTFMNFGFIGGAGIAQWLSGRFVQAQAAGGAAPAETFAGLHLAFGAALVAAALVYALAPRHPTRADLTPRPALAP